VGNLLQPPFFTHFFENANVSFNKFPGDGSRCTIVCAAFCGKFGTKFITQGKKNGKTPG
jgi:hypothetical protein